MARDKNVLDPNNLDKVVLQGKDLNFEGYNPGKKSIYTYKNADGIELAGYDANINRVLFWLTSKQGDYGRQDPFKGGELYKLIGIIMSSDNLSAQEATLRTIFNSEFSGDLELLRLSLIPQKFPSKKLKVEIVVRDLVSDKVSQASSSIAISN